MKITFHPDRSPWTRPDSHGPLSPADRAARSDALAPRRLETSAGGGERASGTGAGSGRDTRDTEFAEYMAARQRVLLRTAYLLTGDRHAAEDLVQDALAKLYLSWHKVRSREAVDAYARRILVNECSSMWRRGWKRRECVAWDVPERGRDDHYDDGSREAVWRIVESLPPKARAVLVLRYYEQLSEAETAAALRISVGTVKSQTSRALAALRTRTPAHMHPHRGDTSACGLLPTPGEPGAVHPR